MPKNLQWNTVHWADSVFSFEPLATLQFTGQNFFILALTVRNRKQRLDCQLKYLNF